MVSTLPRSDISACSQYPYGTPILRTKPEFTFEFRFIKQNFARVFVCIRLVVVDTGRSSRVVTVFKKKKLLYYMHIQNIESALFVVDECPHRELTLDTAVMS
ncbi:hypothetical protein EVAR_13746_1 [Eumeta japonica]|uniref:Uncharacterized protein n=1 Tax=Eumeta variegata TaxID=151549 RepID=A0A4C1UBQ6_EUMVA|nr:hypothetical protein EVAR_13746_1 [Eumeta japonica]